MADVPYNYGVPEVAPDRRAPDNYQHIQAGADSFGGTVAKGLEQFGAGALKAGHFFGQVAVDDSWNGTQSQINRIMYGDPNRKVIEDGTERADTGFMGLKGRKALDAWPDTQKQIDELIKQGRGNLTTPEQQFNFDHISQRYRSSLWGHISRHADTQANAYYTQVNEGSMKLAEEHIRTNADSPEEIARGTADLINAAVKNVELKGAIKGDDAWLAAVEGAKRTAVTLVKSATIARLDTDGQQLQESAYRAGSAPDLELLIGGYYTSVDELVRRGVLTPQDGAERKKTWVAQLTHGLSLKAINSGDPTKIAALVADLESPKEGSPYGLLRPDQREQLIAQGRGALSREQGEAYERIIVDASAGKDDMPDRRQIETDPYMTESTRNNVLRMHDKAVGDAASLQAGMEKFANPAGAPFNPYDKDERDVVDRIFTALGGDQKAFDTVLSRTGMVPKSIASIMRGALVSDNPVRAGQALQVLSNVLTRNPNAFAGVEGKKDFEDAATTFRHYVDDLGMTVEQAARKYVEELRPEYQSAVRARIKAEDVDKIIKDKLSVSDLMNGFNQSFLWYGFRPNVAFSPGDRLSMFGDYAELFKENYLHTGNVSTAKTLAQAQLKNVWGVTSVTGKDVVMKYPPERAAIMAGVENPSERIAAQAITAIKDLTGKDVTRDKIEFEPISGLTANAYNAGRPAPYTLWWTDEKGIRHTDLNRDFVVDVNSLRTEQAERRRTDLAAGRASAAIPLPQRGREAVRAARERARARFGDTARDIAVEDGAP